MDKSVCFDNISLLMGDRLLTNELTIDLGPLSERGASSGRIVAIAGASGVGKTSLARLLVDEDFRRRALTSGHVRVPDNARAALLPQQPVLAEGASVRDNLELFKRVRSQRNWVNTSRLDYLVELFGLGSILDRPDVRSLSGGEAQRLMLVRTLSLDPDILILDEPFVGIDARSKSIIARSLVHTAAENGTLIILISHSFADIRGLADAIVFLERDKDGTMNGLSAPQPVSAFSARPPTEKAAYFTGFPFVSNLDLKDPPQGLAQGHYVCMGGSVRISSDDTGILVHMEGIRGDCAALRLKDGQRIYVPSSLVADRQVDEAMHVRPESGFGQLEQGWRLVWPK